MKINFGGELKITLTGPKRRYNQTVKASRAKTNAQNASSKLIAARLFPTHERKTP